jgi:hypothetical protein
MLSCYPVSIPLQSCSAISVRQYRVVADWQAGYIAKAGVFRGIKSTFHHGLLPQLASRYPVLASLRFCSTASARKPSADVDWHARTGVGGEKLEQWNRLSTLHLGTLSLCQSSYPVLNSLHSCSTASARRYSAAIDWRVGWL